MNRILLIGFGVIMLFVVLMLTQIILSFMLMSKLSRVSQESSRTRLSNVQEKSPSKIQVEPNERIKRPRVGLSRLG